MRVTETKNEEGDDGGELERREELEVDGSEDGESERQ